MLVLDGLSDLFGDSFLLCSSVKYSGTVLSTPIWALMIQVGSVMGTIKLQRSLNMGKWEGIQ